MGKYFIPNQPILVLLGVMPIFLSACQSPPLRSITEQELVGGHQEFIRSYQSDLEILSGGTIARMELERKSAQLSNDNALQVHDMLVLSGGGAFGAFGAGFLKGWGDINEAKDRRPQFDSVSGISTGSLIAPFAFIGTAEAYEDIISLYENPGSDWVKKRSIFPYLPGNVSIYDISKLHETVQSVITENIIERIRQGAAEHRQLLVGATNLDYGMLRVWDLARFASEMSTEDAVDKIITILSASTAIPGLFPPVEIDDLLYVDGGATMQIVNGMDDRSWAYDSETTPLSVFSSQEPIRIRVWIIVNQKLLTDTKVVRSSWTSIAARSLNTLLRASTLQSIQDTETFVNLVNKHPDFVAQMRYVAIPQDFPIADSDVMFDAEVMKRLVELGMKMGADPTSWKEEALRPGASFESN
jgi:hypothetical protein